jgi:hypothetical protein
MPEGLEGQGGADNFDVEAFMAEADAGEPGGIPDTQPEPAAPAEQPAAPPTPAAATAQEFEITANGQLIKAPVDKVKQWASQGYDYAQKMAAFKAEQEKFGGERNKWESQYKPIDEYIQKNPEWWQAVQEAYQARELAGRNPNDPIVQALSQVKSEISEIKQFKQEIAEEKAQAQRAQEDQQLTTEIQSIQEQYPDLDWKGVDESGKSLEIRVIEHAVQNGIKTFRAAFRDFNHDQLIQRAEAKGKEAINKDIQKRTKLGLLGKTPAPTQQALRPEDVRNKSYEDITQDILSTLESANAS